MANSAMEAVGWRSQTHSGRLRNASKAANEEVRQMAALVSHTASKLPPTIQSTAKSTPRAVATPLPPLNRRNTGNMCPRMAAPPAASSHSLPAAPRRCWATSTASAPFPMSPISVTIPAALPATLRTLVNPMFRLPASRGSIPPTARPAKMSTGMAPRREHPPEAGAGQCPPGHTDRVSRLSHILAHGEEEGGQDQELVGDWVQQFAQSRDLAPAHGDVAVHGIGQGCQAENGCRSQRAIGRRLQEDKDEDRNQ